MDQSLLEIATMFVVGDVSLRTYAHNLLQMIAGGRVFIPPATSGKVT